MSTYVHVHPKDMYTNTHKHVHKPHEHTHAQNKKIKSYLSVLKLAVYSGLAALQRTVVKQNTVGEGYGGTEQSCLPLGSHEGGEGTGEEEGEGMGKEKEGEEG